MDLQDHSFYKTPIKLINFQLNSYQHLVPKT
jgi:hypothetical protein